MKRRRRGSLVWRLYLVGVIQLSLVVIAALLIGSLVAHLSTRLDPHFAIAQIAAAVENPNALDKVFAEQRGRRAELSLYDAQHQLVASNVRPALPAPRWSPDAPPLQPSSLPPRAAPHTFKPRPRPPTIWLPPPPPFGPPPPNMPPPLMYAPMLVHGQEGVLVARFYRPAPSTLPVLLTLGAGLLLIFIGAYLTARWIALPLDRISRAAGALGRGDLGARADDMRRADALGEVGRAFNEMASRIQALVLSEKELLANVAHELRTPVARIRVALEIAAEGDAHSAHGLLQEIALDLSELEALIEDVLTVTRFELVDGQAPKSGLPLHIAAVPARSIAEHAAQRFRARHPERPLLLGYEGSDNAIEVDPLLFRRAIDNLLENADKYTPDPHKPVKLSVNTGDSRVLFEIEDQGVGIAPEDMPRIFVPFFRGERSRSRSSGGVGLGLTLTKRIVEAHAGSVDVASDTSLTGGGTIVRVTLPVPIRVEASSDRPLTGSFHSSRS
jgi:signal transduction histidine kinase